MAKYSTNIDEGYLLRPLWISRTRWGISQSEYYCLTKAGETYKLYEAIL